MSPRSLDPKDPRAYRRRARAIVFVAILFLIGGIGGLLNPDDLGESVIARELARGAQVVWLLLFAIGGLLVILGVLWPRCPRPELEVLGLWPMIGGSSINLLTLIVARGPLPPPPVLLTVALLGLSVWTLHGRILDLEAGADVAEPGANARPRVNRRHERSQPYYGPERRSSEPPE